jgi:hypothetical protein
VLRLQTAIGARERERGPARTRPTTPAAAEAHQR